MSNKLPHRAYSDVFGSIRPTGPTPRPRNASSTNLPNEILPPISSAGTDIAICILAFIFTLMFLGLVILSTVDYIKARKMTQNGSLRQMKSAKFMFAICFFALAYSILQLTIIPIKPLQQPQPNEDPIKSDKTQEQLMYDVVRLVASIIFEISTFAYMLFVQERLSILKAVKQYKNLLFWERLLKFVLITIFMVKIGLVITQYIMCPRQLLCTYCVEALQWWSVLEFLYCNILDIALASVILTSVLRHNKIQTSLTNAKEKPKVGINPEILRFHKKLNLYFKGWTLQNILVIAVNIVVAVYQSIVTATGDTSSQYWSAYQVSIYVVPNFVAVQYWFAYQYLKFISDVRTLCNTFS